MAEQGEYRFEIADLTPMLLSMKRLGQYISPLVDLFGYETHVHLIRVDEGSAVPCILAENHIVKGLQQRLLKVKSGDGSRKSFRAVQDLNDLLAEDKTSAVLRSPYHGLVLEFPGIKLATEPLVGPIQEYTEIQGELIQIGGRDDTISLHVREGRDIIICTASRDQGRDISLELFKKVRIGGDGRWIRNELGQWKLMELVYKSHKSISDESLSRSVDALRALADKVEGERFEVESE
jgi:hypothetical protein